MIDAHTTALPDPELLARVAHLRMHAMRTVDGMLAGLHRSPHRGASMTFVEHRDYVPGDDLRLLDWRAFARNDRYVIRRFEQESQQTAHLALDVSSSMQFGDEGNLTHKGSYAATLLSAIGYVLLRQGDAVGACTFDQALRDIVPARQRPQHFETLLQLLGHRASPATGTSLHTSWNELLERAQHRRLIVIATDLIDFHDEALSALTNMRALGHEAIVFHVLHRDEVELSIAGAAHVEGLEQEAAVEVDASTVRQAYQDQVRDWLERCETACREAGVRYVRAITDQPPETILTRTLIDTRGRGWA